MASTIIVPFAHPDQDPDRIAAGAIPIAATLARQTGGRVLLASIVDVVPRFDPLARRLVTPAQSVRDRLLEEAGNALREVATRFDDVPVDQVVRWGNPVDSLSGLAAENEDSIMVVASRVRQGLDRALYGSIAQSLVREAPCPVVVVHGVNADARPADPALAHVLVPLDRTEFSERALAEALKLVTPGAATIHLLHVVEPYTVMDLPVDDPIAMGVEHARTFLEGIAAPLMQQGHRISLDAVVGRPADEIVRAANELEADLVVMATQERAGFRKLVFGSNAERVLQQGERPVMFVKPQG
jgi:nucleotide-binding universal stress UspA family protein